MGEVYEYVSLIASLEFGANVIQYTNRWRASHIYMEGTNQRLNSSVLQCASLAGASDMPGLAF